MLLLLLLPLLVVLDVLRLLRVFRWLLLLLPKLLLMLLLLLILPVLPLLLLSFFQLLQLLLPELLLLLWVEILKLLQLLLMFMLLLLPLPFLLLLQFLLLSVGVLLLLLPIVLLLREPRFLLLVWLLQLGHRSFCKSVLVLPSEKSLLLLFYLEGGFIHPRQRLVTSAPKVLGELLDAVCFQQGLAAPARWRQGRRWQRRLRGQLGAAYGCDGNLRPPRRSSSSQATAATDLSRSAIAVKGRRCRRLCSRSSCCLALVVLLGQPPRRPRFESNGLAGPLSPLRAFWRAKQRSHVSSVFSILKAPAGDGRADGLCRRGALELLCWLLDTLVELLRHDLRWRR